MARTPRFGFPAAKAPNTRKPQQSSRQHHNPRVGGSSPSSGIAISKRNAPLPEVERVRFDRGWEGSSSEKPVEVVGIIGCVKPIRTDFKGYEGKYVATDTRTGQVVIADENLKVVLEKARKLDHVVVGGRVPHADEPIYVGLG